MLALEGGHQSGSNRRLQNRLVPDILGADQYGQIPFPVHQAYQVSLKNLRAATLDPFSVATPGMFRIIDCQRFIRDSSLVVYETHRIPNISYLTVSSPRMGMVCDADAVEQAHFGVYDAAGRPSHPISMDILLQLCSYAQDMDIKFLWIDPLCNHEDFTDTTSNIESLHKVFRCCKLCVALPIGLQFYSSTRAHHVSPWMSEARTLLEALTAPVVDILDSGRIISLVEWLHKHDGQCWERDTALLLDVLYFRNRFSTEEERCRRYLSTWLCILCREDSRPKGLLPIIICLLSPPEGVLELDHQITLFKQDVLDPCSQDPIIIAFRDAIALIGSDISPQWESVVQSLELPMIEGPRRGMGGDSFPCPIINLKVKSSLPSISAYGISLRNLKFTVLDTSYVARPRTFRLLDCKKYVKKEMLVIHEYRNIPSISYATVSYPWVGVACRFDIDNPTFRVKQDGGRDGDPISINVLGSACLLALREGLQFLWLDRLCISQLDREDKPWQIHRMCKVFKQCCLCIILPGGLQRIATLYEETPWIKRMWTLQEAILPPKGFVVYNRQELEGWNLPIVFTPLRLFNYYHPVLHNEPLTMATIPPSTVTGFSPLKKFTRMYVTEVSFKIRLLGRPSAGYARLLYNALSSAATSSQNRKYQQYLAIWESAITRSSDRPRDLLLSTMGIFDIELEEGEQRSEESVFAAFVKEFRKEGPKGARITAFRVAVSKAHASVSVQWRQLIDDLYHSFPLLDGGISPAPDYGLPPDRTGPAIFVDGAGHQVFLGSALLVKEGVTSLQPCPIIVSTPTSFSCRVPSDDLDKEHNGHWELLPFDSERMEWVSPCDGFVPPKRTPVEGGYEMSRNGQVSLYYALTTVVDEWGNGEEFIGKAGRHFQGSVYRSGSDQHIVKRYLILCWKDDDQGETWEEWKASLSDFESESEDGRLTED